MVAFLPSLFASFVLAGGLFFASLAPVAGVKCFHGTSPGNGRTRPKDFVQMDCGPRISHCLKVECEVDGEAFVVKYCGQKCAQAKCGGGKATKVRECVECGGDLCNSAIRLPVGQIGAMAFGINLFSVLMAAFIAILCSVGEWFC